jgi:hypothetical protein
MPFLLYPQIRAPSTYWIGGWVVPRVSLDNIEKIKYLTLPEFEIGPLGHPAQSQLQEITRKSMIIQCSICVGGLWFVKIGTKITSILGTMGPYGRQIVNGLHFGNSYLHVNRI